MAEQIETVIIGGGQAGLALSYYLTQQNRTHLVLEQGWVGETWRSGRWDSFTLNTPNWMTQLPGFTSWPTWSSTLRPFTPPSNAVSESPPSDSNQEAMATSWRQRR